MLVFKLRIRSPARYLWLAVTGALYGYFIYDLRKIPIEAFHFVEYGLLGFLLYKALSHRVRDFTIYFDVSLLVFTVGMLDEVIQWITPNRYGELRDMGINGISGVLSMAALWLVVRPATIKHSLSPRTFRVFSACALSCLAVFGLCALNTPPRVFRYTQTLPFLQWLRDKNVMNEFGYRHRDPGLGIFFSRMPREELRRQDRERASIDAPKVNDIARLGRDDGFLQKREARGEIFLHELQLHLYWRERHSSEKSWGAAWGEQLVLETYFGNTLALTVYQLAPERRASLQALAADSGRFVSRAEEHLFAWLSERQLIICLVSSCIILLLANAAPLPPLRRLLEQSKKGISRAAV